MKRIVMTAMILVLLLISIGGCVVRDTNGRGERERERDRDGEYDRDGGYEKDNGHDMRNTIMKYI